MSYKYKEVHEKGVDYAYAYDANGECVERIVLNANRRKEIFGDVPTKAAAKTTAKKATRKAKV